MSRGAKLALAFAAGGVILGVKRLRRHLGGYELQGKNVLVTGGSRGLGLVLARQLADAGARVALCARDPDELSRAEGELSGRGAAVIAVACDLTDRSEAKRMVQSVQRELGPIDVLINCAGVIEVGPVEDLNLSDFHEAMDTNFYGALHAILEVLPQMQARRQGRIVNISSIGGKVSVPHLLPYCASKFALYGLSAGLRAELRKDGILVTTVCPGLMRTGSTGQAFFKGQNEKEYAWFTASATLPFFAIKAERAARRILDALLLGEAEVVISVQAKVADRFHALFPGLTADLLGLVNRLLPGPGGIGKGRARGADSVSPFVPTLVTRLADQAARKNNES